MKLLKGFDWYQNETGVYLDPESRWYLRKGTHRGPVNARILDGELQICDDTITEGKWTRFFLDLSPRNLMTLMPTSGKLGESYLVSVNRKIWILPANHEEIKSQIFRRMCTEQLSGSDKDPLEAGHEYCTRSGFFWYLGKWKTCNGPFVHAFCPSDGRTLPRVHKVNVMDSRGMSKIDGEATIMDDEPRFCRRKTGRYYKIPKNPLEFIVAENGTYSTNVLSVFLGGIYRASKEITRVVYKTILDYTKDCIIKDRDRSCNLNSTSVIYLSRKFGIDRYRILAEVSNWSECLHLSQLSDYFEEAPYYARFLYCDSIDLHSKLGSRDELTRLFLRIIDDARWGKLDGKVKTYRRSRRRRIEVPLRFIVDYLDRSVPDEIESGLIDLGYSHYHLLIPE